ncbi:MAG: riboflavin synthase [Nitrospirae bacterium]|nr:riboflavin synthase [Nitrospirota bacterium]
MFTGIIEDIGTLTRIDRSRELATLTLSSHLRGLKISGSIAVNGICLTIVRVRAGSFTVDAARETLARTTLKEWSVGRTLNLERPLRVGSELGGHFVQGHVDAVGRVLKALRTTKGMALEVSLSSSIRRYVVEKGSIGLDGVSLTVNRVDRRSFSVFLIPFTLTHTSLASVANGQTVNIETDLLARHAEKLLRRH